MTKYLVADLLHHLSVVYPPPHVQQYHYHRQVMLQFQGMQSKSGQSLETHWWQNMPGSWHKTRCEILTWSWWSRGSRGTAPWFAARPGTRARGGRWARPCALWMPSQWWRLGWTVPNQRAWCWGRHIKDFWWCHLWHLLHPPAHWNRHDGEVWKQ